MAVSAGRQLLKQAAHKPDPLQRHRLRKRPRRLTHRSLNTGNQRPPLHSKRLRRSHTRWPRSLTPPKHRRPGKSRPRTSRHLPRNTSHQSLNSNTRLRNMRRTRNLIRFRAGHYRHHRGSRRTTLPADGPEPDVIAVEVASDEEKRLHIVRNVLPDCWF